MRANSLWNPLKLYLRHQCEARRLKRLTLFRHCLDEMRQLRKTNYSPVAVQSIIDQLEYLIAVESGAPSDWSTLNRINIGILTVREIGDMDGALAQSLYAASNEAREMAREH